MRAIRNWFGKMGTLAMVICAAAITANAQTQERPSGSRFEGATVVGAMIAGKEIGRGVNATGGHEQLIATLSHGGAFGLRAGIHNDLVGLEANFLTTASAVSVNNEVGVGFPNHGKRLVLYSGDALLYPLRRAVKAGKFRPYLTSGVGGTLMSADLDNINDQELHNRLMWNAGGGVKVFVGEAPDFYLDLRVTNHRLFGERAPVDLRSITVGVGYRF